MQIINNQKDFDQICKDLAEQKTIFMDTEFDRRRTYYAKLSIIQVAFGSERIIIDVLSGVDISALKEILLSKNITKVFHAPDQDFDILFNLFGDLPKNVFDTQIAAGVVGIADKAGYSKLCKELLHINLDKTMQKADWLMRPLSQDLLNYAIKDVEYLIPIYRDLFKAINDRKLWDTYNARSKKLLDTNNYIFSPEKIVKKINLQNYSKSFQNKLLYFIQLREECAQEIDIPRNFCASDQDLIELCKSLPITEQELQRLKVSARPLAKNKFKAKILDLCAAL